MDVREELVESAVSFLEDPQVSVAPLAKRIEFLKSKELTQPEIDEALKRASQERNQNQRQINASSSSSSSPSLPPLPSYVDNYGYQTMSPPPPTAQKWKDLFLMGAATVGVAYGLFTIVKNYIAPAIIPPSKAAIELDKESIDEEFRKVEAILYEMKEESNEMKEASDKRGMEVDKTIKTVDKIIDRVQEKHQKQEDDMKLVKSEVENIKTTLRTTTEQHQDLITHEMNSLRYELQTLKSIVEQKARVAASNPGMGMNMSMQGNYPGGGATRPMARSVPSVASIPSASDILNRNKNPTAAPITTSPAVGTIVTGPNTLSATPQTNAPADDGIPAWQKALKK